MEEKWTQEKLQKIYLDGKIQENLGLDYKRAASLNTKSPKWLDELTKDVSAMANSAGGIIIYGIEEKDEIPIRFDPIDKTNFSRERLDQVIASNVKPRIEGLEIHPVPIDEHSNPNHIVFVVEIPQSNTAHQATDKRYHRRLNTTTTFMEDYEIRDVMNRGQHPKIVLEFILELETEYKTVGFPFSTTDMLGRTVEPKREKFTNANLIITAINNGSVYAQYVSAFIRFHTFLMYKHLDEEEQSSLVVRTENGGYEFDTEHISEIHRDNTVRDIVDIDVDSLLHSIPKFGPARYEPILPKLSHTWTVELDDEIILNLKEEYVLEWEVFADNASPSKGQKLFREIEIVDNRGETE